MAAYRRRKMGSAAGAFAPSSFNWCPRGDSNPHAVKHRLLRPACLPVPPPGQSGTGKRNVRRAGGKKIDRPETRVKRNGPAVRTSTRQKFFVGLARAALFFVSERRVAAPSAFPRSMDPVISVGGPLSPRAWACFNEWRRPGTAGGSWAFQLNDLFAAVTLEGTWALHARPWGDRSSAAFSG